MSQYEARLERDMGRIHKLMEQLTAKVENALEIAVRSLLSGSEDLAFATVVGDEAINRLVREIDKQCYAFIALHLPSAGHLRRIQAILHTNLQLERVGDYAVTIAREGVQFEKRPSGPLASELEMIANDGRRLLHQALQAFLEGNGDAAHTTRELASNAEGTMDRVYAHLLDEESELVMTDRVALFAVHNMLKRLWDQSKNISEQTMFWVLGESKPTRLHQVLFIDEENSCLSQMAEAIARKTCPERAVYASAGRVPAESIRADARRFMELRGIDISDAEPKLLAADPRSLGEYFVVVSVEGPWRSYFSRPPFHTACISWDVGAAPHGLGETETEQRFEELYRELALNVRELTGQLVGEEA